jgi:hypothetical protein
MRYLLLLLCLKVIVLADGFWTIDEYIKNHPSQKPLMQQFEAVVQN